MTKNENCCPYCGSKNVESYGDNELEIIDKKNQTMTMAQCLDCEERFQVS